MPHLCLLRNAETYEPCDWNLTEDHAGRTFWLDLFDRHADSLIDIAASRPSPPDRAALRDFREYMTIELDRLRREPTADGRLVILELTRIRHRGLIKFGIGDAYEHVKAKENEAAISLYASIVSEADARARDDALELLMSNLMAGNIFDLGSMATLETYRSDGLDFQRTRNELEPRPWLVDDLDEFAKRLAGDSRGYRQALFFVDNAGADIVLGCVPLARHLAKRGCRVVLAANTEPSLNDITASELNELLGRLRELDPALGGLIDADRIAVVESGCVTPLIDLGAVSRACDAAAAESDLVILEGMGRAIESNYYARFSCDCLRLAMLKEAKVAERLGGGLYDVACKFDPA